MNRKHSNIENAKSPESWLDEHGDSMFRFAMLRLHDEHVAEELVQEAFVKAIKSFDQFRGDSTVRTWLIQILKNEIGQYFRRKSKTLPEEPLSEHADQSPQKLSDLLHSHIHSRDFKTHIERQEFWSIFRKCMAKLPSHFANTFLIRMSAPDENVDNICSEIGIKPSNFSVRLFRTRLLLRDCLEKYWLKGDQET